MATIVIKTQAELDALPNKFDEFTVIEIRSETTIQIKVLWENSRVELRGNSRAMLWGNSTAVLWENSTAMLWGNSRAELWGNSRAELRGNSRAVLRGNSRAVLRGNSRAELRENSTAMLWENSRVELWGNSTAMLWGNSRAELWGNSRAELRENSTAELWENSTAMLWGNSRAMLWGNSTAVLRGNSTAVLRGNSTAELRGNSTADLYDFSLVAVLSSFVIINKLMDYSAASLRGVTKDVIKEKSPTSQIIKTPEIIKRSFNEWLNQGYVHADGITKKFISRKKIKDIEVFEVEEFLEHKSSYVVKRGDVFSHGETIAKAKEDLKYKISNRDTSQFKKWKLTDKKTVEELITAYRVITGACELGVKQFFNGKKFKSKMTISEAIKETTGQFGHGKFAGFFK